MVFEKKEGTRTMGLKEDLEKASKEAAKKADTIAFPVSALEEALKLEKTENKD